MALNVRVAVSGELFDGGVKWVHHREVGAPSFLSSLISSTSLIVLTSLGLNRSHQVCRNPVSIAQGMHTEGTQGSEDSTPSRFVLL